jgi:hypothetical protein
MDDPAPGFDPCVLTEQHDAIAISVPVFPGNQMAIAYIS